MGCGIRWRELEELAKHTFSTPIDDSDASGYDTEDNSDLEDDSMEDDVIIDSCVLPVNDMGGEHDPSSEDEMCTEEDLLMKPGKVLILGKVAYRRELNAEVSLRSSCTARSKRSRSISSTARRRARPDVWTARPASHFITEDPESILGLPHPESHENYVPWPKDNTGGIFIPWPLFGSNDTWPHQTTEKASCPETHSHASVFWKQQHRGEMGYCKQQNKSSAYW